MKNRLLWPLIALAALLVLNLVVTPSFFALRMQDGHLYGGLVDVLKNGAPTLLIALGMTRWCSARCWACGTVSWWQDSASSPSSPPWS